MVSLVKQNGRNRPRRRRAKIRAIARRVAVVVLLLPLALFLYRITRMATKLSYSDLLEIEDPRLDCGTGTCLVNRWCVRENAVLFL